MGDQQAIRNVTKQVLRSKGGQVRSEVLFERMYRMGVSKDELKRAIRDDMGIEIAYGIARLVEK